jgi:hypothetical protein
MKESSRLAEAITLLTCAWEVIGLNLGQDISSSTKMA